jgi:hypothetical protein
VAGLPIDNALKYESGLSLFKQNSYVDFPYVRWSYVLVFCENLSLIPLLGLVSCLYMMAELSVWNWIYF